MQGVIRKLIVRRVVVADVVAPVAAAAAEYTLVEKSPCGGVSRCVVPCLCVRSDGVEVKAHVLDPS